MPRRPISLKGAEKVPPGGAGQRREVLSGGAEGLFVEGGDEPQPGVQVQPWGPERIDERLLGLLVKYDTGLPPQ